MTMVPVGYTMKFLDFGRRNSHLQHVQHPIDGDRVDEELGGGVVGDSVGDGKLQQKERKKELMKIHVPACGGRGLKGSC